MQQVMEKNPQIRHALSDPAVLKDLFSMVTNKTAYTELMRGHDRQLSNLENIPQGFQQLQRLYQDMDAASSIKNVSGASQLLEGKNSSEWMPSKQITMDPMPNPWKKPPTPRPHSSPTPKASASSQTSLPSIPPAERFAVQLGILKDMGFTDQPRNIAALESCHGNVNLAIEWLVRHAEEEQKQQ
jgi:ubiquilin